MDLDTFIRDSDPTRSEPSGTFDSAEAQRLLEQIVAGKSVGSSTTRFSHRRTGMVALASLAVTAVVVGTIVVSRPQGVSTPGKTHPARAATVLHGAALEAAANTVLPTLGPGQYYYEKTLLFGRCVPYFASGHINQTTGAPLDPDLESVVYLQSVTFEQWSAADGSGMNRESYTGHFQTSQEQALWDASGAPNFCDLPARPVTMIPPRSAQDPGITMLPSDPTATADLIAAGRVNDAGQVSASSGTCPSQAGASVQVLPSGDVCNVAAQFDIVNNLLENPGAPIKLGPVLYEVLAKLPSVQVLGTQTDALGRTGTAIEDPNSGDVFVIDTSTGTLLESETVATPQTLASGETNSGIPPGTILGTTTYADFGVTTSLGAVPATAG